jgi:hypothetical protein
MENNNALTVQGGSSAPTTFNFFNAEQFAVMQRVCNMFASSELVPTMYKVSQDNPKEKAIANCMIAIEMAQRIGASPLMIMQNMVIICGRPSWSAKFLISTVNTCGRFEPLKYRFKEKGMLGKVDYTDYVYNSHTKKKDPVSKTFDGTKIMDVECVAYTTAKGSEDILESSPISVRLAVQEGWYTKSGSKWQTMTRQMLMYRAASFWTNAYAPELSMGMKTEEEIRDIVDVAYEDVTEKLAAEKEEHANKSTIGFDAPAAPTDKSAGAEPSKESGVTEPSESAQPATATAQPAAKAAHPVTDATQPTAKATTAPTGEAGSKGALFTGPGF